MPTFNQLVRKGRKTIEKQSDAPALQKGYNSLRKKMTNVNSPQKEVFVLLLRQVLRKTKFCFEKSAGFA